MLKKLFLGMLFFLVLGFSFAAVVSCAEQGVNDLGGNGGHITQADIDKIYKYEKLMREYIDKKVERISEEQSNAVIKGAGFKSWDHFGYVAVRISSLQMYLEYKYDMQGAKDMEQLLSKLHGGEVKIHNSVVAEMALERLDPKPTEAEIKLIMAN